MRHGSLFSGGGGFDLAAEALGWINVFHSDIDPFCNRILDHYWPEAHSVNDIRTFNATLYKGKIDIITGGFPCQPFSSAGKRRGTADSRHLWPEMLRIVREIKPTWVVGENVYGILSWNGGMVFEQVHTDLEAEGYEVQAFILPAVGVNAPHRRYRVWFIAHAATGGRCTKEPQVTENGRKRISRNGKTFSIGLAGHGVPEHAANPYGTGLEGRTKAGNIAKKRKEARPTVSPTL